MQPQFLEKNFTFLFAFGLLIGLFFSFLYANHQILTGDQFQMLEKGYLGAYKGVWQSYGNAASAVGNVPGLLSALVVGIPLMFWDSPWAPMVLLIALHLASFLLFNAVIKQIFNLTIQLIFLFLYWLNPWFLFENVIYNPSYLFFFTALHFWSAYHMREDKSFGYTILHLLSIAMAMQLHYSWIILAMISLYLYVRGIIKINWFAVIAAFFITALSLIPYFQAYLSHPEIRQNPGNKDHARYIGWGLVHVYPIFKGIIYWFRYPSFLFSNTLSMYTNFDWLTSHPMMQKTVQYTYKGMIEIIGIASLWIVWKANYYSWKSIKPIAFRRSVSDYSQQQWLSMYALGAFIAILISGALSPIVFNYWHVIITFGVSLLPIIILIDSYISKDSKHVIKYLFIIILYFGLINLIAANDSKKYSYKADYSQQARQFVYQKFSNAH
ncbi:3-deoxy-D-manno-octulosonic acid transferase [Sulfuricurvum sp.]|uniref:3-deoxy-D-manno-octulosonic acid transferase n=1 Tax=Sulfuricurvum sp. TaxID=2025608 RepID=UPI002619B27F|nr:3-deoxy-D-manno-octulosonic acid transferase [Sulfuricurvum sp.]MDD2266021.1 3-deoxy-D-manno-octulosonic acid transferase [Sulfuricurvum sp.]MDD2783033.1 3-deoxy-D-manno-octulosonic acid transferase [Sulfuricurvum sp.]